ncbi:hypothetical protein AzCIB_2334 [Azoarcus sp. CIB]|uniref:TIGR04282 family arsenosugar biosynthesis glycosyltransferase n=1 Tax=Aromatoleum sp. (strain CIB) TaxID=198107 RepID=UPI0006A2A878|nr:TIGR04282 family arsenosugar biosynthesis glycosyltransferase [Azoarcus sp. CIB]AKU12229.1 hypothetical protein AzCIB_2334 [Azoarcus sp. CIB]
MKPARVVIIAKAPIAGFAKTRLTPALGAEGAARLARRMLEHTVRTALEARVGAVELCVTPSPDNPIWKTLDLPDGLEWSEQGDGDLGARMARATERTTAAGEAALLIGTDCPGLTALHLRMAAEALVDHDAAIVPTVDGGYALLALRRFHPCLFTHMPWSTDAVAFETLCRIGRLGWNVKSAQPLHDIDEPEDLAWLPAGWHDDAGPPAESVLPTPSHISGPSAAHTPPVTVPRGLRDATRG